MSRTGSDVVDVETAIASFDQNLATATSREAWIYHGLRREIEKLVRTDEPASKSKER